MESLRRTPQSLDLGGLLGYASAMYRHKATALASFSLVVLVGCATGGGASAPAKVTGPVELDGTRWKLLTGVGGLDGRVVEFKKRGDRYEGTLVETGLKLRDARGVQIGMRFFSLTPTGNLNEFTGVYEAPNRDGSQEARPVSVSISADNTLIWNLGSAWTRVE